MDNLITTQSQLDDFEQYTINYLGYPIDSVFSEMFRIKETTPSNTSRDTMFFLDPTAKHKIDVIKSGSLTFNGISAYFAEPDIWIGKVNIFDRITRSKYPEIYKLNLTSPAYFIVLRRLGSPSISYSIENKLNTVYIMKDTLIDEYCRRLSRVYNYPCLEPKILDQNFVDQNYDMINILDY